MSPSERVPGWDAGDSEAVAPDTQAAVWERLARDGLVQGPPPPAAADRGPWYVAAMVGMAAWIAALFLLAFIGAALATVVRNTDGALIVGGVIIALAVALLRVRSGGLFLQQLAVACSLAGQALIIFSLADQHWREPLTWAGIAVFEAALIAATAEPAHRVLSALACLIALRIALLTAGAVWLVAPLLMTAVLALHLAAWRMPLHDGLWSPLWAALGLVVVAVLPLTLLDTIFWYRTQIAAPTVLALAGAALVGIMWLALVAALVRTAGVRLAPRTSALVVAGAVVIAVCAWRIPMVAVAVSLLLVAFAAGRSVLAGMALLALLAALAHSYYALEWSLLAKAGALAATGAVLLLAAASVRYLPTPGAGDA